MYPLLSEAIESKKYDTRLVDRNVVRGLIAQSEVDSGNKTLPDDADNAEFIPITMDPVPAPSRQKIKGR